MQKRVFLNPSIFENSALMGIFFIKINDDSPSTAALTLVVRAISRDTQGQRTDEGEETCPGQGDR